MADVITVRRIVVVLFAHLLQSLGAPGVLAPARFLIGVMIAQQVDHEAVAQPAGRNKNIVEFQVVQQREQSQSPGDNDIGAFWVSGDQGSALGQGLALQEVQQTFETRSPQNRESARSWLAGEARVGISQSRERAAAAKS